MAGAVLLCMCRQGSHTTQLVVARKDLTLAPRLLAPVVKDIDHTNEPLNEVEDYRLGPNFLPEVAGGESSLGWRVAGAAIRAPVERQEHRLLSGEFGAHVDHAGIDSKMSETTLEAEKRFLRISCLRILLNCVANVLPCEFVFQLRCENGQAVQENGEVE